MNKEKKVILAFSSIKQILSDFGIESIKRNVELDDGTEETFECIKEVEQFVVDVINKSNPLKFEELEEDMWVWDDMWEKYRLIHHLSKKKKILGFNSNNGDWICFKENRFYRYEVKR